MLALPTQDGATRLILIRHGEVEEDARRRCYGRLDVKLSPLGHEQAARTAEWIAELPIAALWSSPLTRAVDSAAPLARATGLAPRLHDGLREIDCGQLEGMTYPEIRERYPEMYAEWRARLAHTRFPGGESYVELHARVTAVAAEIRAAHAKAAVAIVAHGGVTRALLADALGLGAEALFRLDQSYAGVSVIDYYSETAVVRVMNATP
ncbi:MAG TPA: histidine phosphatase family protein [Polyangia bacterium]|nr:histidine phosphatase family protein [Polyangia bacterium]